MFGRRGGTSGSEKAILGQGPSKAVPPQRPYRDTAAANTRRTEPRREQPRAQTYRPLGKQKCLTSREEASPKRGATEQGRARGGKRPHEPVPPRGQQRREGAPRPPAERRGDQRREAPTGGAGGAGGAPPRGAKRPEKKRSRARDAPRSGAAAGAPGSATRQPANFMT